MSVYSAPWFTPAVQRILAGPDSYRQAYDRPGLLDGWTWHQQADILNGVYAGLLKPGPAADPQPAGEETAGAHA